MIEYQSWKGCNIVNAFNFRIVLCVYYEQFRRNCEYVVACPQLYYADAYDYLVRLL